MIDVLTRPRALRTLVSLDGVYPEPMTMRQFCEASGYLPEAAILLREDLVTAGLITVEEIIGKTHTSRYEIRPTDLGRKVAALGREIQRIVEQAHAGEN